MATRQPQRKHGKTLRRFSWLQSQLENFNSGKNWTIFGRRICVWRTIPSRSKTCDSLGFINVIVDDDEVVHNNKGEILSFFDLQSMLMVEEFTIHGRKAWHMMGRCYKYKMISIEVTIVEIGGQSMWKHLDGRQSMVEARNGERDRGELLQDLGSTVKNAVCMYACIYFFFFPKKNSFH